MTAKQACQKPGPSVVLIGNSAASSGLLKLCGSDMGREDASRCCDETTPKQGGRMYRWTRVLMDANKSS